MTSKLVIVDEKLFAVSCSIVLVVMRWCDWNLQVSIHQQIPQIVLVMSTEEFIVAIVSSFDSDHKSNPDRTFFRLSETLSKAEITRKVVSLSYRVKKKKIIVE